MLEEKRYLVHLSVCRENCETATRIQADKNKAKYYEITEIATPTGIIAKTGERAYNTYYRGEIVLAKNQEFKMYKEAKL